MRSAASESPAMQIRIEASTWARDSHDLYDFEASQLHVKSISCSRNATCVRVGTDIDVINDPERLPVGAEALVRVLRKDNNYWVEKTLPASSSKRLWMVVKDLAPGTNRITKGDTIKLGRFKFRVHQTMADEGGERQPDLKIPGDDCIPSSQCVLPRNHEELHSATCRICLLEGSSDDDPLIKPCQCKGSIEYVHLGCLRQWIRGRMNLEASAPAFFYKRLACELCKTAYPVNLKSFDGQENTPLVEVPRLRGPFIVLERVERESRSNYQKGLHVVSLADRKTLTFGRSHDSDLRVPDVSISRHHAQIRLHDGQFYIEDLGSKFGTLICAKKPRMLGLAHPTSIQVGRTVLTLSIHAEGADPNVRTSLGTPTSDGAASVVEQPLQTELLDDDVEMSIA